MRVGVDPVVVDRELQYLLQLIPELLDAYRWMVPLGWERQNIIGEKVSGSGVTDPVGRTVASDHHREIRSQMERATRMILDGRNSLIGAFSALQSVLSDGEIDFAAHPDYVVSKGELKRLEKDRDARYDALGLKPAIRPGTKKKR